MPWRSWRWWWRWLEKLYSFAGFERERSKDGVSIEETGFLESKALFQKLKSISFSFLIQLDEGLVFGGLICRERSGWAGNSSIFFCRILQENRKFDSFSWSFMRIDVSSC